MNLKTEIIFLINDFRFIKKQLDKFNDHAKCKI